AMAGCMAVGVVTTLIIREPSRIVSPLARQLEARLQAAVGANAGSAWERFKAWFANAVVGPFAEFFARNGSRALVLLALVATYLMSDYLLGVMAGPFYIDMGYSKVEIANVAKLFGLAMTLTGAGIDRKSTRLNSSHVKISYAVFCHPGVLHSFPTRRSSDLRSSSRVTAAARWCCWRWSRPT